MDFKQVFVECCQEFKVNVISKFKEHNNFRVTAEDVVKTVQNYPIHKNIFNSCFKEGSLLTLRMVHKVFGDSCVRINQHKDLSIVAPLWYVTTDNVDLSMGRGDLVIPVCKLLSLSELIEDQYIQVFVPSGCDDDLGHSNVSNSLPLSDLFPLNPNILPEERLVGYSITVSKGDNYVSIKAGHGLVIGDFLDVRGKNYEIQSIHPDDCFASVEGSRNMIYVKNVFLCNVKDQVFRYRKMVYVNGRLLSLKFSNILTFRGVSISFKENKNKNNHGNMVLSFSCAIFNASGFYTRSLAITEADM